MATLMKASLASLVEADRQRSTPETPQSVGQATGAQHNEQTNKPHAHTFRVTRPGQLLKSH